MQKKESFSINRDIKSYGIPYKALSKPRQLRLFVAA